MIEHVITDADTIQTLAVKYFGDVSRWKDIADFNSLEYPYIVSDRQDIYKLHASGYLTVTRAYYDSLLVIRKGSIFSTKFNSSGIKQDYEVVEDAVLEVGQETGQVYVRCTILGSYGNVLPGVITEVTQLITNLGEYVGEISVTNELPFNNGVDANIKTTGDVIFIPTEEASQVDSSKVDLVVFGGEDLALDEEGFLEENNFGDLLSVSGLDNIVQAVRHRLMTEAGSLLLHPEYGTNLSDKIGQPQLPYINKLIELDILEAFSYEDRLSKVEVTDLHFQGTACSVSLVLTIGGQDVSVNVNLDF